MPLLGDSKSVYVGNTPITKVMAGDVQVWPKGPDIPGCYPPSSAIAFYSFEDNLKSSIATAPDLQNVSLSPLSTYEFIDGPFDKCIRRGYSTNTLTDLNLVAEISSVSRPFTLEAWIKIDEVIFRRGETVEMEFSSEPDAGGINQMKMQISNGTINPRTARILCQYGYRTPSNTNNAVIYTDPAYCGILADQWFHFAISCDMDGTNGKAWINGKFLEATGESPFNPVLPLKKIAVLVVDSDNESHINVDELRLSKGIVYPDSDITPCS